jgi:hypothetical protein
VQKITQKNNKILVIILGVGLLLVAIFFLSADTVSKNGGNNNESVNLDVSDNIEKADKISAIIYSFDESDKESTVFSGLVSYGEKNDIEIEYNNYDFGILVESVGNAKNSDDGKSWMYYVNDVLGDAAADKKVLEAGDKVEWRFEESPF